MTMVDHSALWKVSSTNSELGTTDGNNDGSTLGNAEGKLDGPEVGSKEGNDDG
jgi:hypothetical protein